MSQTGTNPAPGGSNAGGRNYGPKNVMMVVTRWRSWGLEEGQRRHQTSPQKPLFTEPHTDVTFKVIPILGNIIIAHCNINVVHCDVFGFSSHITNMILVKLSYETVQVSIVVALFATNQIYMLQLHSFPQ